MAVAEVDDVDGDAGPAATVTESMIDHITAVS